MTHRFTHRGVVYPWQMALVTMVFGLSAFIIWSAPKPAHVVGIAATGHREKIDDRED